MINEKDFESTPRSAGAVVKSICSFLIFAMQVNMAWSVWGFWHQQNVAFADSYRDAANSGYAIGGQIRDGVKNAPPQDLKNDPDPAKQNSIKLGTRVNPVTGAVEDVLIDKNSMMPSGGSNPTSLSTFESGYGNAAGTNAAVNQLYNELQNDSGGHGRAIQTITGNHGGTNGNRRQNLSRDSMFGNVRSSINDGTKAMFDDCEETKTVNPSPRSVHMPEEKFCIERVKQEACSLTRTISETVGPKQGVGYISLFQDHGSRFKLRLMDLAGGLNCSGGGGFSGMPECMAGQGSFFEVLPADYLAGVGGANISTQAIELPEPGTVYKFSFADEAGQCNNIQVNQIPAPENDYVLDLYVQCTAEGFQSASIRIDLQRISLNSTITESEPGCLDRAHAFGDEFCQAGTPITHTEEFKRFGSHAVTIPRRLGQAAMTIAGGGGGGGSGGQPPGSGGGGGGSGEGKEITVTVPDEARSLIVNVGRGGFRGEGIGNGGGQGGDTTVSYGSMELARALGGSGGGGGSAGAYSCSYCANPTFDDGGTVYCGSSGGFGGGQPPVYASYTGRCQGTQQMETESISASPGFGGAGYPGGSSGSVPTPAISHANGGSGGLHGAAIDDKQAGPGGTRSVDAGYGKRGGGAGGGAAGSVGGFGGNGYLKMTYSGKLSSKIQCTDSAPRSLPNAGIGLTPAVAIDSRLETMYLGEFYDGKVCFQSTVTNACEYNETTSDCYTDINGNQQCPEGEEEEPNCNALKNNPQCSFIEKKCVEKGNSELDDKTCYVYESKYDCGSSQTVVEYTEESSFSCGAFKCMGDSCFGTPDEKNTDFAKATAGLNAMNAAKQDMECSDPEDPSTCKFFKGNPLDCKRAVGGIQDCCDQPVNVSLVDYLKTTYLSTQMSDRLGMTKALTGMETTSGYLANLAEPVTNSISEAGSALADLGKNLMQPVDELIASTFGADAAPSAIAEGLQEAASSATEQITGDVLYDQVGTFLQDTFGEYASDFGLTVVEGTTATLNPALISAFSTVMTVYMAVQLAIAVIQIIFKCEEHEFKLAAQRELRACHNIGSYCKSKALFACIETRNVFCCFGSPLSRIMQEQIRPQLGMGWGQPTAPQCGGLSITDFERVNWDLVNLDEYVGMLTQANLRPDTTTEVNQAYGLDRVTSQYKQTDDGSDSRTPNAVDRANAAVPDSSKVDDLRGIIKNNTGDVPY